MIGIEYFWFNNANLFKRVELNKNFYNFFFKTKQKQNKMNYLEQLKGFISAKINADKLNLKKDGSIDMLTFVKFVLPNLQLKEFHLSVIKILDIQANLDTILDNLKQKLKDNPKEKESILAEIKHYESYRRIMIFAPPQHGKSEMSSRIYPTYLLGKHPDAKIVVASYNKELARGFMRDSKKILIDEHYRYVFPDSKINDKNVNTDYKRGALNNADVVEVVNKKGRLSNVGVGGGLTGNRVDFAILDDLVKNDWEAYNPMLMEKLFEWYKSTLYTRLNNKSKVLLLCTRWSTIDIVAKILEKQPLKWQTFSLPAIMDMPKNEYDTREIGEALFPEMHSIERLLDIKEMSLKTFTSMFQQRPTVQGGNLFKKEWFGTISKNDFKLLFLKSQGIAKIKIDGAYTSDKSNDPTGLITTCFIENHLYIMNYSEVWLEMPDLIKYIKTYFEQNTHISTRHLSNILVEPKANGHSIIQTLKRETLLNVDKFKFSKKSGLSFDLSKGDRAIVTANLPFVES